MRCKGFKSPQDRIESLKRINSNCKSIVRLRYLLFYTVYQIQNKINNKIYIGKHQTKCLDDGYMGSGKHLERAITFYGKDHFEKTILFVFDTEAEMNSKEAELVTEEFCKRDDTYNLCPGGDGGFGYLNSNGLNNINKDKIDIYRRTSEKLKGKLPKHFDKFMFACKECHRLGLVRYDNTKGSTLTEEHKAKIGAANSKLQTGIRNSQYGTMWITNGIENRKVKKDNPLPDGFRKGRINV